MHEPAVVWMCGSYTCTVTEHPVAQSYELRIVHSGRVVARRWFTSPVAARDFARAARRQWYDMHVGGIPHADLKGPSRGARSR